MYCHSLQFDINNDFNLTFLSFFIELSKSVKNCIIITLTYVESIDVVVIKPNAVCIIYVNDTK